MSRTDFTAVRPGGKSQKVKTAFKSIGSYFASEDSTSQPGGPGWLSEGLRASAGVAGSISTLPNHHHSRLQLTIPTLILSAVAYSPTGTQVASQPHPNPVQHTLWQKAFGTLLEHEQQALSAGNPGKLDILQNVLDLTIEKRDLCREKEWKFIYNEKTIILREVADKLLEWVKKFKEIGDFVARCDTAHAAIPWEAFKFLLQFIEADSVQMGSILIALERIAILLDRCAIYERLYLGSGNNTPATKGLERALTDLYATILRILSKAKRYYELNAAVRMVTAIAKNGGILSLLGDIDSKESEVKKAADQAEASYQRCEHGEIIDGVSKLRDILEELESSMAKITSHVSELVGAMEESKRMKVLKWISTVPYHKDHEEAKKGRVEATGHWFPERNDFKEWQKSGTSATFWLRGDPGAGKTKLTSFVVDLLKDLKTQTNNKGLAYFYCNRDKNRRRNPDSIFRTILKQLSYRPDFSIHQLVIHAYERRIEDAFSLGYMALQESKRLIIELLKDYSQTTIVIDALDECGPEEQEVLLEALDEIVKATDNVVKIFVSSRDSTDITRCLKDVPYYFINATDNGEDIRRFVESLVRQQIQSHKLLGGNVSRGLEELICSTLQQSANGRFRWIHTQIKVLCGMGTESDVRDGLARLHVVPELSLNDFLTSKIQYALKKPLHNVTSEDPQGFF